MTNNDNAPVTSKQFGIFELATGGFGVLLSVLIVIAGYTWSSRVDRVDQRFEKLESKLDQLIVTTTKTDAQLTALNNRLNTLTTLYEKNANKIGENVVKIAKIEAKVEQRKP